MIQLAYDTAYDPYHTAFRMLRLCTYAEQTSLQIGKIRILDFYLNFPHLLNEFFIQAGNRLPPGGKNILKKMDFAKFHEPYSELPNIRSLFYQMEVIQASAIQTLCLRGFLDMSAFKEGSISVLQERIPTDLLEVLKIRNDEQDELLNFLVNFLGVIEMDGSKGLKALTHLMEHRYDAI